MRKLILALVLVAGSASAADVGVSISVGEPGFYGRIDIGDAPAPRLIFAEPVFIRPVVVREPLYLHVPPGHAKHWDKHCASYGACDRRVFFVDDDWYETVYVPHHHAKFKAGGGPKGHGKGGHGNGSKGHGGKGHGKGDKGGKGKGKD